MSRKQINWRAISPGIVIGAVFLFGLLLSLEGTMNPPFGFIPVSLLSSRQANYSPDRPGVRIAPLNLRIIEDALRDWQATKVPQRFATVLAGLQTPVATVTPFAPTPRFTQPTPTLPSATETIPSTLSPLTPTATSSLVQPSPTTTLVLATLPLPTPTPLPTTAATLPLPTLPPPTLPLPTLSLP